ncbi:MAG: Mpo1-like protein [Leptospiraceae bacterium]|nr:Mpo1-like protein [Leptospiraceae bacterium]
MTVKQYSSFKDFYPFYLGEHSNRTCRRLHFVGSSLVLILLVRYFFTFDYMNLILIPIVGYGFAWVGHFFFEKNKPATFQYPVYSLIGDWKMYFEILTGKIKF